MIGNIGTPQIMANQLPLALLKGAKDGIATFTNELALMPDQQLPRLAQQFKNDAITLSLILNEKTRRDHLRNASKVAQAAQPQPKVNDQVVASMQPPMPQAQLPEDVGIGALPARNLQGMADGGIVGYKDTGLVIPGPPAQFIRSGMMGRRINPAYEIWDAQYGEAWRQQLEEELKHEQLTPEEKDALGGKSRLLSGPKSRAASAPSQQTPPMTDVYPDELASGRSAYQDLNASTPRTFEDIVNKTPAAPTAAPTAVSRSVTPGGGLGDLKKQYQDILAAQNSVDPAAEQRAELQGMLETYPTLSKLNLLAEQKRRGDVYKDREERQTKREQELSKAEDKNLWLSVIDAGLTMAGTSGTFGEAVSKGGRSGVRSYVEGLDKIRAAKDRLADARDRLEDLRINRDDMNAREIRAADNAIHDGLMQAKKLGIEGIMARDGVNRDMAGQIFGAQVKQGIAALEGQVRKDVAGMDIASRERIAAAPTGEMRGAMLLGTGKTDAERLESGLKKMQEIQADKTGMTAFKILGEINAKHANDVNFTPLTLQDLLAFTRQYSAVMHPKVSDTQPTRARPD